MPKNNWREKFKEEFGIHFEDLSGELGFAIEFIKEEKELSYKQGKEKRIEYDKNGWKELVEEEKEKALAKQKEEVKKMIEGMVFKEYRERGNDEFEKAEILREQGFNSFRLSLKKKLENL